MLFPDLPPTVEVASCEHDLPVGLLPSEEAAVRGAVTARRAEFATTRHLARQALLRAGAPWSAVPARPDRSPAWPEGWRGSLTHCAGLRAAAAARAHDVLAVGIDAEPLSVLDDDVRRAVLAPDEEDVLRSAPDEHRLGGLGGVTVFSAKESFFKAWHPRTGRWLDLLDARLVAMWTAPGGREGVVVIRIRPGAASQADLERWPGPTTVPVPWRWHDGRVHTSVVLTATCPTPAAQARPGHRVRTT